MATWLVLILCAVLFIPLLLAAVLFYRLTKPKIVSYPWPRRPNNSESSPLLLPQTVILAGSFNPPHRGHLAMVEYLAQRYSEVVLVVGVNPQKTYAVSPQQRKELLEKMTASLSSRTTTAVTAGSIRVAGAFLFVSCFVGYCIV